MNYSLHESSKATLNILDLTGRIIYSKNLSSPVTQLQINTSTFSPGSYVVEISYGNDQVLRRKFNIIK